MAADIFGQVFKNGSATLLARVIRNDGALLTKNDASSIHYTVYQLDDDDPDYRAPQTGHTNNPLDPAACVFDSLQTDALWSTDATGYNFRHTLSVGTSPAFPVAGVKCLVEYAIQPPTGQKVMVRFKLSVI